MAAGADLVIGHGPHVVRAVEWRDSSLVLYSLGNLVTYGPFSHREPMRRGVVACATVDGRGAVRDVRLHPTVQRAPGRVAVDRSRRALTLIDSLSRLDFPRTGARVRRDGRVVRPPR
jgi:poly-gamma-glutamate capsule biosynthesis protein CapA/YwtB (metallophosphatase superfamily)